MLAGAYLLTLDCCHSMRWNFIEAVVRSLFILGFGDSRMT
jgi:hypothetical protein